MKSKSRKNQQHQPAPWFVDAIGDGIQRLFLQGFDRQPAGELAKAVVLSWSQDLWPTRDWSRDRDESRIAEAFRRCRLECAAWPTLAFWQQRLPRLVEPSTPALIEDDASRENGLAHVREILAKLGVQEPAE